MFAVAAVSQSTTDPLAGLHVGELAEPAVPADWVTVDVVASALNHHDLWSLKGVGLPADRLPMILGCDAVGHDAQGNRVIVYPVITSPNWAGDATMDPRRSLLSEVFPGTLAERVRVPVGNLVPVPEGLPWEQAACLPTAWLTAYRMIFTNAGVAPGDTILVQGAGGGVATAAIALGAAAGIRVWATSRDAAKLEVARELGAADVFASGARLPERVDAVLETVGAATWSHSVNALRPGGTIVISGATSGDAPARAELTKIFFKQLRVVGSTMGTREELARLARFVADRGISPLIDSVLPLAQAREGFAKMAAGEVNGKIVGGCLSSLIWLFDGVEEGVAARHRGFVCRPLTPSACHPPPVRNVTPARGSQGPAELLDRQRRAQTGKAQSVAQRPVREGAQGERRTEDIARAGGVEGIDTQRRDRGLLGAGGVDRQRALRPSGDHRQGHPIRDRIQGVLRGGGARIGHGLSRIRKEGVHAVQAIQHSRIPPLRGIPAHIGEEQRALAARLPHPGGKLPVHVLGEVDEHGGRARRAPDELRRRDGWRVPVSDHGAIPLHRHRHGDWAVPIVEAARMGQVDVLARLHGPPAEIAIVVIGEGGRQSGAQTQAPGRNGEVGDSAGAGRHTVRPLLGPGLWRAR